MSGNISVILTMLSPVAEARLGVPLGLVFDISPALLMVYAFVCACVIYFAGRICLNLVYNKLLSRFSWCEHIVNRTRNKGSRMVQRYGWFGLFLFVVIPVPGTGAYSGTLVSWFLGLHWWKSAFTVISGATLSAFVILMIGTGVMELL